MNTAKLSNILPNQRPGILSHKFRPGVGSKCLSEFVARLVIQFRDGLHERGHLGASRYREESVDSPSVFHERVV
jgi:hypothetical protein